MAGELPQVPVHVDSPMALSALRVYREAISADSPEIRQEIRDEILDPFDTGNLDEARTVEESVRLNDPGYPCIVISASGMATGGRVLHHLEAMLPDPRNTVVLAGFQAQGTRGRALAEGARSLKMYGRYVPVRAEVVAVDAFSVHADSDEILAWLKQAPREPEAVYVVHGEPEASATLADRIVDELDWPAVVPRHGERVRLD
jgi:metallo-beta-lactamase family protein